jgi:group I intron endonuclease
MIKELQGCIYLLRNLINGKGYVGQHINLNVHIRWNAHICGAAAKRNNHPLYNAIRKHGVENFSAEVVWRGPVTKLDAKEVYYIKKLHTFVDDPLGHGYNLTIGGNSRGYKFSVRSRKKLSKSMKAYWAANPDRREAVSRARLGKKLPPFSDEHKARIGDGHRGKKVSKATRAKLSKARLGMKLTEEWKAKIGASSKGHPDYSNGLKGRNRDARGRLVKEA